MSGGGKVIGRRRAREITQAAQARSGIRARKLGDTLDEAQRVALTAPWATPLRVFFVFKALGDGRVEFYARRIVQIERGDVLKTDQRIQIRIKARPNLSLNRITCLSIPPSPGNWYAARNSAPLQSSIGIMVSIRRKLIGHCLSLMKLLNSRVIRISTASILTGI